MSYYRPAIQTIASSSQLPVPTAANTEAVQSKNDEQATRSLPRSRSGSGSEHGLTDESNARAATEGEAHVEGEHANHDGARSGRMKVRGRVNYELLEKLAAQMCNVRPFGACGKVQGEGSLYCEWHTCQAINADGDRCRNGVGRPSTSRICAAGYHAENSRNGHLVALLARKKIHDEMASLTREEEHQKQVLFFDANFAAATTANVFDSNLISPTSTSSTSSTSSSTRWGRSSHTSSSTQSSLESDPAPRSRRPSKEYTTRKTDKETWWGAYGVDKWWIGNWQGQPVGEVERTRWAQMGGR
ncbi:hypothetical protein CI109_101808 [Kwoniella shandongensis]|uniref:Uncharacterized protein n=1 Tax=Kwoniella shandongensis TaxID=1734106 RepID=A0A5M6C6A9_9TREE|nr:uncharacterized protein CI109_001070 [Kwoniella shandongensis]KAA5530270.1 hypothetical protein CI109_001070 [Kwoniella shandongensis]